MYIVVIGIITCVIFFIVGYPQQLIMLCTPHRQLEMSDEWRATKGIDSGYPAMSNFVEKKTMVYDSSILPRLLPFCCQSAQHYVLFKQISLGFCLLTVLYQDSCC